MKCVCVLLIAASWAVWPAEADVAPQPAGELRKHDNSMRSCLKYVAILCVTAVSVPLFTTLATIEL